MANRSTYLTFSLMFCLVGCDETSSMGPQDSVDATRLTDASVSMDSEVPPTDGQLRDGSALDDAVAPFMDEGLQDMGWPNECLEDNGGCGDPTLWRCQDSATEPPTCTLIPDDDYAAITEGVDRIIWGGSLPDSLVIHGRNAFPIAVDTNGRAMIAGARFGAGRVLHVAHESLMSATPDSEGDGYRFLQNSMQWLASDRGPNVLLENGLQQLRAPLETLGYTVAALGPDEIPADTAVVLLSTYGPFTPGFEESIRNFAQLGGGVFTGGHAWWFAQSTGQDAATQYPGNHILDPIGLVIAGLADIVGQGVDLMGTPPSKMLHATLALDAVGAHLTDMEPLDEVSLGQASATIAHAIRVLPADHPYFSRVQRLIEAQPLQGPTADRPLRRADDPVNALLVQLQTRLAEVAPADALPPIPGANDFPGNAADAEPVVRTLTVDGNYAGRNDRYGFSNPRAAVWRSTGLYARPGEPITVEFEQAPGQGVSVLVGCHTDQLWNRDEWQRYPVISRSWPISEARTIVGNAFGGPIYIRFAPGSELGPVTMTITGAIEMPLFQIGRTSARDWRETIRSFPAPWAELAGENLVITLPSSAVREIEDPTEIIEFWDSVMDLSADLAAIDRERLRPERFVVDRQISVGLMHSGYPLMAHLESVTEFIDVERVRQEGAWGPFHEIGHNHQLGDWVLPGTTEANVNLWSVYISETALNLSRDRAHPALAPEQRSTRMRDYLANGAAFADWTVWTALETYLQLQAAFGWQFYQDLFAEYLDIPDAQAPRQPGDKIDEWIIRSSQRAGVNLIPYYTAWGFPISDRVQNAVGDLAEWVENPMNP